MSHLDTMDGSCLKLLAEADNSKKSAEEAVDSINKRLTKNNLSIQGYLDAANIIVKRAKHHLASLVKSEGC